jgi:hypothetical protein
MRAIIGENVGMLVRPAGSSAKEFRTGTPGGCRGVGLAIDEDDMVAA